MAVPGTSADMAAEVADLEAATAQHNATLAPLANFLLPGGDPIAADVHLARAVCRRAERSYWRFLSETTDADTTGALYLNRLSDGLFVLGRIVNARAEHPEVIWQPRTRSE
jgi:cob(I)alamin adenosyltransferase